MTERLRRMLERAEEGRFAENSFDETMCSALESEMADYLNASERSMKNITEEKDKIKTLIADISHQTKTPVSNLLLYTELLKEKELPASERAGYQGNGGRYCRFVPGKGRSQGSSAL